MRKREYESKLNCLKRKIKEEEKKLNLMINDFSDDFTPIDIPNKISYINGIKIALHLIQTHTISPKARKSNNLQDLYSRNNNSYYD